MITGATSSIASQVVHELLSQRIAVRALVRSPEKAEKMRQAGAEIIVGDLEKPETLQAAFNGIEQAFILTPLSDRASAQFSNALWAAKQAGVRYVARLSACGADHDAPTINGRHHALSDSELIASNLAWTIMTTFFHAESDDGRRRSKSERQALFCTGRGSDGDD